MKYCTKAGIKTKLPKCNGRPQLWYVGDPRRRGNGSRLRIVYPSGIVEYLPDWSSDSKFMKACTSSATQERAVYNCLTYCVTVGWPSLFLGYL